MDATEDFGTNEDNVSFWVMCCDKIREKTGRDCLRSRFGKEERAREDAPEGIRRFALDTFSKLGISPRVIAARRHHAKQLHAEFAACPLIAFSVCWFLDITCEQMACITHDSYVEPSR